MRHANDRRKGYTTPQHWNMSRYDESLNDATLLTFEKHMVKSFLERDEPLTQSKRDTISFTGLNDRK